MIADTVKGEKSYSEKGYPRVCSMRHTHPNRVVQLDLANQRLDEDRVNHRYVCNHEELTKRSGFVVCKICGTCIDNLYTYKSYVDDHHPLSVVGGTQMSYTGKYPTVYSRMTRLNNVPDDLVYSEIFVYTKSLLSNLGLSYDLSRNYHKYMCSIHADTKKHTPMRGVHVFVPVMVYLMLHDLNVNVSKKEILNISGISETKMNKGIRQIRMDMGIKR